MVAEGPAMRMFDRMQQDMIEEDLGVMAHVVQAAIAAERLPPDTLELLDIQAVAPTLAVRDRLQDAQADQILVRNQAMSVETMAARHGLSPDHEQQLISRRADVREANFNPNEPRDERGRWTGDGTASRTPATVHLPSDRSGVLAQVNPSAPTGVHTTTTTPVSPHIDTTPPPLSPARQTQRDRAGKELDQLVKDGKISRQERDLRYAGVRAALGHHMGFDNTEKPNPAYFEEKKNNKGEDEYHLRPGLVADAAHDRAYRVSGVGSNTGCERASQTLMLEGQTQLAKAEGKGVEFDKEVGGKTLDDLYPRGRDSAYQKYTGGDPEGTPEKDRKGLDTSTFVPGDRVWMENHRRFEPGTIAGGQGSNVIYSGRNAAGEQVFAHMEPLHAGDTEPWIETEKGMRSTVRSYTPNRPDDEKNYKFERRYAPTVAPSLKSTRTE